MRTNHHDVVEARIQFVLQCSEAFAKPSLHPDPSDGASRLATDGESESGVAQFILQCVDEKGTRLPAMSSSIHSLEFSLVSQAEATTEAFGMAFRHRHQSFSSSRWYSLISRVRLIRPRTSPVWGVTTARLCTS